MMIKLNKTYHIIVIICVAAALVAIKMLTYKSTPPAKMENSTNIMLIDGKLMEKALCDSCRLSGDKLTCSPALLNRIIQNVDQTTLRDVTKKTVVFNKNDGYLEVPAPLMTNLIDLNLFTQPIENK